ncbi:MAG: tRNA (adenosine(37)-N6)-threonylcarbamoyltransferase complex ATPase subunit type 1 TsaE [Bacteriovoracaceae bacterium]
MKELRAWKIVLENDLEYIVSEVRDILDKPAVLILSGPVGAGKTTFTKKFIGNNSDPTQSPTYSIVHEKGGIAHADFFRLKDSEEVIHLEIPLYLENKEFFIVEWGRPFLKEIQNEVGEEFSYYELDIQVNEQKLNQDDITRNYSLKDLGPLY